MIWEIHLGVFDTFTKVRTCGHHPGRMSGVGLVGVIFMSLLFYMFKIFPSIYVIFFFFGGYEIYYFP